MAVWGRALPWRGLSACACVARFAGAIRGIALSLRWGEEPERGSETFDAPGCQDVMGDDANRLGFCRFDTVSRPWPMLLELTFFAQRVHPFEQKRRRNLPVTVLGNWDWICTFAAGIIL